jgi:hypothetical protein
MAGRSERIAAPAGLVIVSTIRAMSARRSPSSEPVSGGTAMARLRSEMVSTTSSCFVRHRR